MSLEEIRIPTALTLWETRTLRNVCRGKVVYEAGALLGYSTVAIAQVAKMVISVDPHDGYPRNAPRPTWDLFCSNICKYNVHTKVQPKRNLFQQVPVNGSEVAWADLTGRRDVTEAFLRHADSCPLLALHDYGRSGCAGATDAVDEWISRNPCRPFRVDTLILLDRR